MRTAICLLLALVLLFLSGPAPTAAEEGKDGDKKEDGDKKDGKSKLLDGEEEDEGEDEKSEPKPATYKFKDYLLTFEVEDGRWWKQDTNYTEDDEKYGIVVKLVFKLPKTDESFDLLVRCQGWGHDSKLSFEDGSSIGSQNYKGLADKFYEQDLVSWKEAKDVEKPKAVKLNREFKKVYRFALTGLSPGGNSPLRKEHYLFKHKAKTYSLTLLYTTGSYKKERVREEAKKLLESLQSRKKGKR